MKNYKFIIMIFSVLIVGLILMMTYMEMPAPNKKITKSLDINDVSVK